MPPPAYQPSLDFAASSQRLVGQNVAFSRNTRTSEDGDVRGLPQKGRESQRHDSSAKICAIGG